MPGTAAGARALLGAPRIPRPLLDLPKCPVRWASYGLCPGGATDDGGREDRNPQHRASYDIVTGYNQDAHQLGNEELVRLACMKTGCTGTRHHS